MNAAELFKAGKPHEALAAQTQEVKGKPGDQGKRLFLFELLAFAGDLDRARRQIGAVTYDDPDLETAAAYRELIDAEEARRRPAEAAADLAKAEAETPAPPACSTARPSITCATATTCWRACWR